MIHLSRRMAELVTAAVLLVAVVLLFAHTFTFAAPPIKGYPGSAFFPRLALGVTGVFLVVWIGSLVLGRQTPAGEPAVDDRQGAMTFELADFATALGLSLAFIFVLKPVGFEISCFVLLAVIMWTRLKSPLVVVLTAAVTTLVLYAVFVLLLNVSLPLLFLPRFVSF